MLLLKTKRFSLLNVMPFAQFTIKQQEILFGSLPPCKKYTSETQPLNPFTYLVVTENSEC